MKTRTDYIETSMEAMIEAALAEMEAKGEKLPNFQFSKDEGE